MKHFSLNPGLGLACYSLAFSSSVFAGENENGSSFARIQSSSYGSSKKTTSPTTAPKELAPTCPSPPSSFRFSLKHREANGIGYNQGYSSLDGFFLFHSSERWFPFFDVRAHLFNNGKPAGNFGFGIRHLPDSMNAVFGLNAFLDSKATSHSSFMQTGLGLEILGTKWHMRANGYFPLFSHNHVYEVGFYQFRRHHAIFRAHHDISFKGYDLSCGRILLRTKLCDLSTTLSGYQFFSDYDKRASGGLIKFQSNLTPYCTLETQASYDSLFKGILQIQAAVNIPFGKRVKVKTQKRSCAQTTALSRRIAEEVDRFEMIVSDSHHIDAVGKDPRTRAPLHIVFVENTSSGGSGTAESPYNTLVAAQDNSAPYDMIYVYGGDGTPRNQDQGITLQDGQWLQAASRPFILATAFGPCGVPSQSNLRPSILNPSTNTIILADDNIIVGFDLRSFGANIFGVSSNNVEIAHNHFLRSPSFDIQIVAASGDILIHDNLSYGAQGLSLFTNQTTNLVIENNIFANSSLYNLFINFNSSSTDSLTLRNNTIEGSLNGSSIISQSTAVVTMDIEDNSFINMQSTAPYCLNILSTADASTQAVIRNNAFNSPTPGLNIMTSLLADSVWYVIGNVGHYTGSATPIYPFTFTTTDLGTMTLYLAGNFANQNGYQLSNNSTSATFNAASLDGTAVGLENLNTGSFTINGSITYIPYISAP